MYKIYLGYKCKGALKQIKLNNALYKILLLLLPAEVHMSETITMAEFHYYNSLLLVTQEHSIWIV